MSRPLCVGEYQYGGAAGSVCSVTRPSCQRPRLESAPCLLRPPAPRREAVRPPSRRLRRPPPSSRPRLLLIDGHSIAYRAFFALPVENFSTQTGQHTNAVFGFTSMLINVLRDENPTHVGVAFDVSRQTFRSEIYTEYKANRSKSPDEFRGQLDLVKEVLDALNIVHLEKDGFEADDVIGTLATEAERGRFRRLDLHRGPGRLPAGQRPRHRALSTARCLRSRPDDPGCGGGALLRNAGPLSRARRPGGGVQRQPARGSRSRPQDCRQVARDLRRSGQPRPARRRAQGQGGGELSGNASRTWSATAGSMP